MFAVQLVVAVFAAAVVTYTAVVIVVVLPVDWIDLRHYCRRRPVNSTARAGVISAGFLAMKAPVRFAESSRTKFAAEKFGP